MKNVRLKLSPPWITYVNQIKAMFGADPDINIQFIYENWEVKIFVNDSLKASAISSLLPDYKYFGDMRLDINIIPANGDFIDIEDLPWEETFNAAFAKNPVYAFAKNVGREEYWFPTCTYVVFKNKVVQSFKGRKEWKRQRI